MENLVGIVLGVILVYGLAIMLILAIKMIPSPKEEDEDD